MRLLTTCNFTVERQQTQAQAQPQRVDDTAKQDDSHDAISEPEKNEIDFRDGGIFELEDPLEISSLKHTSNRPHKSKNYITGRNLGECYLFIYNAGV
jgi:hypothetical protein